MSSYGERCSDMGFIAVEAIMKNDRLLRERPFGVFQQVKRLLAVLGFLLLLKVFF